MHYINSHFNYLLTYLRSREHADFKLAILILQSHGLVPRHLADTCVNRLESTTAVEVIRVL